MTSSLNFLIAAKQCEIAELNRLTLTNELVDSTARLVHGLQRERGLSSLDLACPDAPWAAQRKAQVKVCEGIEMEVRTNFDQLGATIAPQVGHRARLYSRIAYVLQGMDALRPLRRQIETRNLTPTEATAAYIRLINGLLALVFEAAGSASDPDISRKLVAYFNFMQSKEFAGQERATGSAMFAAGVADPKAQKHLLHLIDAQERCLKVFNGFSGRELHTDWREGQSPESLISLERLRRILCTCAVNTPLSKHLSQTWFDCCTERMEAMKLAEDLMASKLRDLCQAQLAKAHQNLAAYEDQQNSAAIPQVSPSGSTAFFDTDPQDPTHTVTLDTLSQGYGQQIDRALFDLVQEQARSLQRLDKELSDARATMEERRLIERAKGLLMAHHSLSEGAAHKAMRQMAMSQNRRMVQVAEGVLAMAEALPEPHP